MCVLGALLVCALIQAAPASARIAVDDVQVAESDTATFTITRSAGFLSGSASVSFQTVDGSAGAGDYTARSGSLTFGSAPFGGTQTQQLQVAITQDALDEESETFRLVISGSEVVDGSATATIVDDDPPPALSVLDAAPVQEGPGATARFVVALSVQSGRAVSVAFKTADASATAGQDYVAQSGTLVLPAGATQAPVDVAILDDAIDEPAETFQLQLAAPQAATAGAATAVATIVDDDEPPAAPVAEPGPPPTTTGSGLPPSTVPPPAGPPSAPTAGGTTGRTALGVSSPRLRRPSTVLVTISCPQTAGRCSGRVTLFSIASRRSRVKALRKERKLGRAAFSVQGGRSRTLSMALGRTDRALLRRTGRMKVRAYAITQDGAGRMGVRSVGGTLIARTAHSSPSSK